MITSITLKKQKSNFTNKLYGYKNGEITFNFTDGVNVITGRNGSGKSVLLNIIKTNCFIDKDSTYPRMPNPMDLHGLFSGDAGWKTIPESITEHLERKDYPKSEIVWDGAMVHHLIPEYFDASNLWKMMDSPFPNVGSDLFGTGEIMAGFMSKRSKGEGTIGLLMKMFNLNTEYDQPLTGVNDIWMKTSGIFHEWLKSFPETKGKPTLLIDELDEHLDLDNQKMYWTYIKSLTKKWQVIVVSHSIFAFKETDVNHIPLNKDYFKTVRSI
jgi:energy-coupling factor transporter ATP-binding protein EcfA2